jgi:hypothetical protein
MLLAVHGRSSGESEAARGQPAVQRIAAASHSLT